MLHRSAYIVRSYFPFLIKSAYTQDLHHNFNLCHTTTPCTQIIGISCYWMMSIVAIDKTGVRSKKVYVLCMQNCLQRLIDGHKDGWGPDPSLNRTLTYLKVIWNYAEIFYSKVRTIKELSQPRLLYISWVFGTILF